MEAIEQLRNILILLSAVCSPFGVFFLGKNPKRNGISISLWSVFARWFWRCRVRKTGKKKQKHENKILIYDNYIMRVEIVCSKIIHAGGNGL